MNRTPFKDGLEQFTGALQFIVSIPARLIMLLWGLLLFAIGSTLCLIARTLSSTDGVKQ